MLLHVKNTVKMGSPVLVVLSRACIERPSASWRGSSNVHCFALALVSFASRLALSEVLLESCLREFGCLDPKHMLIRLDLAANDRPSACSGRIICACLLHRADCLNGGSLVTVDSQHARGPVLSAQQSHSENRRIEIRESNLLD